jgi:tetratricopeptide (TPR) repeat protein
MDKARNILEPLVRKFPERTRFATSLAIAYRRESLILTRQNRADESVEAARHAVAILKSSRQSATPNAQVSLDLAGAQMTAGIVEDWRATEHHWTPGFEAALDWLRQSMITLQAMPRGSDTDSANRIVMVETVYQNVSDTERNWGDATGDRRHYEAALSSLRESISATRRLSSDDVTNRRDVADGLVSMGRVLGSLGRFDEAEKNYQAALPEFERLVTADPNNLEAQQDLANLFNYRGETLALAGRKADAAQWTSRAVSMYQAVLQHDPGNREVAQLLEKASARMAALDGKPGR